MIKSEAGGPIVVIIFCGVVLSLCLVMGLSFQESKNSGPADLLEHANVSFDLSPDGVQIVFSSAGGDLFLLNLTSFTVQQLTKSTENESTPAYSPDGQSIIYSASATSGQENHLFSISLDGKSRIQLTHDANVNDRHPRYSSDGKRIAFARAHTYRRYSMGGWTWDDWEVYVMDADGQNLSRLTKKQYYQISDVVFTPDGNSLYYSAIQGGAMSNSLTNVFKTSIEKPTEPVYGAAQPTSRIQSAAWASEADISSNGEVLVVVSDRTTPFKYDLLLIDVDTGTSKSLNAISVSRYNQQPKFSESDELIYFLAARKWNSGSRPIFGLWSISRHGNQAKEVADSLLFTAPTEWSSQK